MVDVTHPLFFATAAEFRRWLAQNHQSATEQWVGFYKKTSGRPSITWQESVDEALCFGWIDGVRKSLDAESYANRFTPRRPGSIWSAVNTRRARQLIKTGRMRPSGLAAFKARDPKRTAVYSFEQRDAATLDRAEQAQLNANRQARTFFESQPPGYRRTVIWWVLSARQPAARARRLKTLIEDSAAGQRIGPLRRVSK